MFHKNTTTLIKIWLLHYIVYYWSFVLTINLLATIIKKRSIDFDFFLIVLISPITALFGLYDGMVILIPLAINYFFMLKYDLKKSFYLTISLCYLGYLFYMSLIANFNYTFNYKEVTVAVKNYFIVIPCLILSILTNWLVFKKTYIKSK
jgi:hypothetical protein